MTFKSSDLMDMEKNVLNKTQRVIKTSKLKKRWKKLAVLLCAIVAVGTTCIFINPATTQTQKVFCVHEETEDHTQ